MMTLSPDHASGYGGVISKDQDPHSKLTSLQYFKKKNCTSKKELKESELEYQG